MNLKLLTILMAILATSAPAACSSDTTASNPADAGGGAPGSVTGLGGSAGGSDARPPCDPAYTCAAAITPPSGDSTKLCAGTPEAMKFATLDGCTCGGACAPKCSDNVCAQKAPTTDCLACIMDMTTGCGKEAAACSSI